MLESLLQNLALVDSFLWGPWTMAFLAGVAVFRYAPMARAHCGDLRAVGDDKNLPPGSGCECGKPFPHCGRRRAADTGIDFIENQSRSDPGIGEYDFEGQ